MNDGDGRAPGVTGLGRDGVLDGVLRGAQGLRPPDDPAPEDDALVAYLTGALSPTEASRVERGLVRHPAARRRLRDAATRLEALQSASWNEVEAASDGVALAWRRLTAARLAAPAEIRGRWLHAGWTAIRAQALAGFTEAQVAWAAFLSFADGWERARRAPRLAEARGAPLSGEHAGSLPLGVSATVEAEVTNDGDLNARLVVTDALGQPHPALNGRAAHLSLSTVGQVWPLDEAVVHDGEAVWRLPGAGLDLGLPPGPLPPGDLAVSLAPGEAPPTAITMLPAVYGEGDGVARVDMPEVPRRENGRLRLVLALPPLTRAVHRGRILAVSVAVAPGIRQRLDAWPVRDWGDGPRTLETPCPGADGAFDPALLSLELLYPERGEG